MSSAVEDQAITQYRSIHSLAIFALLAALASPLVLVTPLLLVIPLAAAALAVAALRKISANADIYSGRSFALAALFLAMFFVAFVPARLWLRSEALKQHGRQLAEAFLEKLHAGDLKTAHDFSKLKFAAAGPDESMQPGFDPKALTAKDYEEFKKIKAIQTMQASDFKFSYHFDGIEPTAAARGSDLLTLRYQIVPDDSARRPFPLWITVQRNADPRTGMPSWSIQGLVDSPKKK